MTALDLLRSLGSTADEVAAELGRRGIKGRTSDACDCPLAKLLKVEGHAPVRVGVDHFSVRVGDELIRDELPAAAEAFASGFDRGNYPELDEDIAA